MSKHSMQDRAAGALMGAFIGDALGLGPHWYYNLDELHRDYGTWIDGYTEPLAGRYHEGMKAGELSQAGYILTMLVRSLVENGRYDEKDFCLRMDEELFPLVDGTPINGPGGYTSQSIREAWKCRVQQKLPWGQVAGKADTTEAIERTLALAVRYALHPDSLAKNICDNTLLTQNDDTVVALTVAYGAVLGALVQGHPLDGNISSVLMTQVRKGILPFHFVLGESLEPPQAGETESPRVGRFASPDALLTPGYVAAAANDPAISIEPAWKVSLVYGMPCAIYHVLPCAYYLAARFHDDFTSAVLHAVNGGGQNMARAMLTGALAGAQTGLSGIPQRFIDGLENGKELLELSKQLAEQSV
ncbi:ADP-ribosylglycohydrolase family protein [Halodesulfovibrio spirochaetisodalis]|uniref:ADP-ribosylglycohydrolase n=1 Tax=Halodesulfovibrio spirochaetisodalis TaxID=1560234 RepID=A0A1B7X9G7_9BACT|nr:ADP-ribosylglycohydrolase family protein [Halodesulfovibrio spirochaetisodalis]OBQ45996.1 ADP-ribosylglycohydrolase [Halodesulfovibrio spirochaetisodalis]